MTEENNNRKVQLIMYVQQLSYLPFENVEALERRIKTLKHIDKYAMIVHDKDNVEAHVHAVLLFGGRVQLNTVAKKLNAKPENFEIMTKKGTSLQKSEQNAFLYLIHGTDNSRNKYQYSADNVKANFHYKQYVKKVKKEYREHLKPKVIIEQFSKGLLSRQKTESLLYEKDPYNIDRYFKKLDAVENAKRHFEYNEWLKKMKKGNQEKIVLWFYGNAGTGKSSTAKYLLNKYHKNYFVSGGSKDVFETYINEHGILLNDLRPGSLSYSDILRLLDPYDFDSMVSSRYHNKLVQGETYIITCPYDPYEFYIQTHKKEKMSSSDGFDQLNRRITAIVHFDFSEINLEKLSIGFNPDTEEIIKRIYKIKTVRNPLNINDNHSLDEMYRVTDEMLESFIRLNKGDQEELVFQSDIITEKLKIKSSKSITKVDISPVKEQVEEPEKKQETEKPKQNDNECLIKARQAVKDLDRLF